MIPPPRLAGSFKMAKTFLPYTIDQQLLLPPDMRQWLPEGHLALFILDLVAALDLASFYQPYRQKDVRGRPAYEPRMMVALLLYAYCTGNPSSRRIERATYEDVAYRVLAGDQHPDHDTISDFRQQHLEALRGLFVQVLQVCQKAGLVKLGHVALDGTKMKADASKHKAMSYERMCKQEKKLHEEVESLLAQAQRTDFEEDERFGKGRRGDELPEELARRTTRLEKIKQAKAELEREARERAEQQARDARAKLAERERKEKETGKKMGGKPPKVPNPDEAVPKAKAQRNFTDSESRIMKDSATKSFVQGYNAQAAVDAASQIVVAAEVTQQTNDKKQLVPMLEKVREQTGRMPKKASADSGYFSEAAVTDERLAHVDLYVSPDRQKHGDTFEELVGSAPMDATVAEKMRHKLKTAEGRQEYGLRKQVVEPVFGQIKEARGLRRFSFRGLAKVRAEWDLLCLTHNLLKLFRAGYCPQPA